MANLKSIFFHIIIISGISLCVGLGFWQTERLEWKKNLISTFEQRQKLPTLNYSQLTKINDPKDLYFRKFSDVFDKISQPAYLAGKYNKDKHGYQMLVINMLPSKMKHLPIIIGWCENKSCEINQSTRFSGVLAPPTKDIGWFMPQNDIEKGDIFWPVIADLKSYFQKHEGFENVKQFIPAILINESSSSTDDKFSPLPQPFEFEYRNDHKQYIITWFSLAVATFLMYVVLVFRMWKGGK